MKGLKQRVIPWLVMYAIMFVMWLPVQYSMDRHWGKACLLAAIQVLLILACSFVCDYIFKRYLKNKRPAGKNG